MQFIVLSGTQSSKSKDLSFSWPFCKRCFQNNLINERISHVICWRGSNRCWKGERKEERRDEIRRYWDC